MKTFLLYISAIFLFAFSSCKKDSSSQVESTKVTMGEAILAFIKNNSKDVDGQISISAMHNSLSPESPVHEYIIGSFNREKDIRFPIKPAEIYIDGMKLPDNGDGYSINTLSSNVSDEYLKILKKCFGKTVQIGFKSINGVSLMNEMETNGFYVPQPVIMDAPFNQSVMIDNNNNYSIGWNPDPLNPSGKILVGIIYEGDYAIEFDGVSVPPGTHLIGAEEIDDNGHYILTQASLSELPVGSRCTIFVARGNSSIFVDPNTGLETLVNSYVYAQAPLLQVF